MSFLKSIFNVPKRQKIGNYQIIGEIGHGNFGTVYLAKNLSTGEQVAIKKFQNERNEIDIAGFIKEADSLLRLAHKNIVPVLNFGLENDGSNNIPYLVMKYLPNKDLETFLKDRLPLSIKEVVVYINAIAAALQHAHNQDIIHRDVKPKNILCGSNGEILLSDFGIATHVGANGEQTTGNIIGTSAYIAPEQIRGQATPASDQYSLAVVAYKWLCNALPFRNEEEHLKMPPPPFPKELQIPIEVEKVIRRALEKQPTKRYDSIQQFAEALERAYSHTDITVTLNNDGVLLEPHPSLPIVPAKEVIFSSFLSQWLAIFLFACGWGAIAGILLHSALWATGIAPLLAVIIGVLFYVRASKQSLSVNSGNTIGVFVFSLALFVLVVVSALSAQTVTALLSRLAYDATDTVNLWSFGTHTLIIGQQIYFGLGVGVLSTALAGSILAMMLKKEVLFWLYLFIECLAFSLAIWLMIAMLATILNWSFGLGASSLETLLSLLVGVMAVTGMIVVFRMWTNE